MYKTKKIALGAALAVCMIFLIFALYIIFCHQMPEHDDGRKVQDGLKIEEGVDGNITNQPEAVEEEHTEIPVYKMITVSEKQPYAYLGNPGTNHVYFSYHLKYEDGSTLYKTDAVVKPGRAFETDLYSIVKERGIYNITVEISTFDLETEESCNGAVQQVQLIVK